MGFTVSPTFSGARISKSAFPGPLKRDVSCCSVRPERGVAVSVGGIEVAEGGTEVEAGTGVFEGVQAETEINIARKTGVTFSLISDR